MKMDIGAIRSANQMQKVKFSLRQLLLGTFWFAVWLASVGGLARLLDSVRANPLPNLPFIAIAVLYCLAVGIPYLLLRWIVRRI